jgi:hypothetical protein
MNRRRWLKSLALALLQCASAVASSAAESPAAPDEYMFVPDTGRLVCLYVAKKGWLLNGTLDAEGDFILAVQKHGPKEPLQIPQYPVLNNHRLWTKTVYELRSGRLIKGVMVDGGVFVPGVGSKVIKFEDYKYSPTAIPIWNLPGSFQKKDPPGSGKAEKK